jgi:hypothetical protein
MVRSSQAQKLAAGESLATARRLIIKIGSSLLVDEARTSRTAAPAASRC